MLVTKDSEVIHSKCLWNYGCLEPLCAVPSHVSIVSEVSKYIGLIHQTYGLTESRFLYPPQLE